MNASMSVYKTMRIFPPINQIYTKSDVFILNPIYQPSNNNEQK